MRLMLFFDGRNAKRAWPVVRDYIRPNVKPKKSNSPSGTLQICVLSSCWSESPGGACTHWKAPPCHGAHPKETSQKQGGEAATCLSSPRHSKPSITRQRGSV